jgi:predicted ATP-grasp superfamily ATP-dependent carboligase
MTVIVTNAKNRIGYAIVRSLGKKEIKVYTSDFVKTAMSFYSRYSYGNFLYPSPFRFQKEFINILINRIKKLKCDVLIPVYEETFLISKYQDILSRHVNLVVPEYQSILSVHDKQKLYNISEAIGIPVPLTIPVVEIKKNSSILEKIHFPALLKPRQGGGAWGFKRMSRPSDLRHIMKFHLYPDGLEPERFLVQELIDGQVYCCALLFNKGSYRAGHCYRQIRETPISGGTATYRESVIHPQIMNTFTKLLEHLQWHGVCHADFIVDKTTGQPFLIDANPRLWGSLYQSIVSAVDFPYLIFRMATEGDIEPIYEYNTNVKTRWIGGDVKCLLEYIRNPEKSKNIKLLDFLKISKNEKFDDFELKDPLPFLMWFMDYLVKMMEQRTFTPSPHDSLEGIWD